MQNVEVPPYSWGVYLHSPFISFYFHLPIQCILSFELLYFIHECITLFIYVYVYFAIRYWTIIPRYYCCWNLFEFNCNSLKPRIIVICFWVKEWANCLSVGFYSGCFMNRFIEDRKVKKYQKVGPHFKYFVFI